MNTGSKPNEKVCENGDSSATLNAGPSSISNINSQENKHRGKRRNTKFHSRWKQHASQVPPTATSCQYSVSNQQPPPLMYQGSPQDNNEYRNQIQMPGQCIISSGEAKLPISPGFSYKKSRSSQNIAPQNVYATNPQNLSMTYPGPVQMHPIYGRENLSSFERPLPSPRHFSPRLPSQGHPFPSGSQSCLLSTIPPSSDQYLQPLGNRSSSESLPLGLYTVSSDIPQAQGLPQNVPVNHLPQNVPINSSQNMSQIYPQIIEAKDKEISTLRGAIRAYTYKLENQENINVSSKLQEALQKLKHAMKAREIYHPYISEESALTRSILLLLENYRFHSDIDSLIQETNDVQKWIKSGGKQLPAFKMRCYGELLHPIKLDQKLFQFETVEKELQLLFIEISKAKMHFKDVDLENLEPPSYTRIGKEFLDWKETYMQLTLDSKQAFDKVTSALNQYALDFKNISEGKDVSSQNFSASAINCDELLELLDAEMSHLKKVFTIPLACQSALAELYLRITKLKKILMVVCEIKTTHPDYMGAFEDVPEEEVKDSQKNGLSLLDYISQSKSANTQAKRFFIQDIFRGLCDIHSKGNCYFFLSPKNIKLSEASAVLCPPDKASIYEPILPFTFFAPECELRMRGSYEENPFSHVDYLADYYSLGRLILWLACVETSGDFVECMTRLPSENPLLQAMLSPDPTKRPSFAEINCNLDQLLLNIFGPVEEQKSSTSWEPSSIPAGSMSGSNVDNQDVPFETLRLISKEDDEEEDALRLIIDEEEEILKEMNDSDNKSISDEIGKLQDRLEDFIPMASSSE